MTSWTDFLRPVTEADRIATRKVVADSERRRREAAELDAFNRTNREWIGMQIPIGSPIADYIRPKTRADEVATGRQVLASRERQVFETNDSGLEGFFGGLSGALGERLLDWVGGNTGTGPTPQPVDYRRPPGALDSTTVTVILGVAFAYMFLTK